MESSRVAFNRPNQISGTTRLSSVRAATRKALYQFVKGSDTIILPSDEIDPGKDRAVNEILARRRQRA